MHHNVRKGPIRERRHRLPPEHYQGKKSVAFTLCEKFSRNKLADEYVLNSLVPLLDLATAKFECRVPIYTFMPDHAHILVHGISDQADTLAAMTEFKSRSAWWFYTQRPDIAWQEDFWDHIVRYSEGYEIQAKYIALNPVRKGLVTDGALWPYTGSIGYELKEVIEDAFW